MSKTILGIALTLAISGIAQAQSTTTQTNTAANAAASAARSADGIAIDAGTQVAAELTKSLNVERAKVGDEVILKTKRAIEQNGEVVIEKGSMLIGRVTEIQKRTRGQAESRVSILFDTLKKGDMTMPISASIVSVTNAAARATVDDNVFAGTSANSSATTRTSARQPSGGLLGGVTNTVGGVANTATGAVGGVVDTTGHVVGSTTGAVPGSIPGLSISQSSNASASGGSTLSMNGKNLNLQKGTTFNIALSSSASVETDGN